MTACKCPERRT